MGCDESNPFEEESKNLCNKFYNLSYEERKNQYQRYVRREFELFYDYLCRAGNDTSKIDKLFSTHQSSEKIIRKYAKEEPWSISTWVICIVIFIIIGGAISDNDNKNL